jgi:HD-GYP domain-containing protein (c-di-GMP phosphodiesterase class II)
LGKVNEGRVIMNESQSPGVPRDSGLWNRYLPVLLAIGAGTAFSIAAFLAVRWWEWRDINAAFRALAEERAYAVKSAFETELAMLELVRTSLMTDGRVEKNEFRELLVPFHEHDESIEAVEWLPRVLNGDRQEFEVAAQRNGFEKFQITEADKSGKVVPAQERNEYFPIYFCGPRPLNKAVIGYDVGSEPIRAETLYEARDTGEAVASGRIKFIQDSANSGGFLVCLPLYARDQPVKTVADRRKHLLGFIMGVFRPSDMLTAAVRGLTPEGIDVCLYDSSNTAAGQPIDFHASRARDGRHAPLDRSKLNDSNEMQYHVKLDVAGRPWMVACLPAPQFETSRKAWWPWGVIAFGMAFTFALAIYLSLSIRHRTYLEDKVREQTTDIRRTQEEVIYRLITAAQWSDEETGMHIRRTGLLSEVLARAASWYGDDLETIRQAAPLHDIGKIGIPDTILRKPGKLTPEEFEVMKTHTRIGADILAGSNVPMLQMAREIALNHHERWDGKGYPRGLAGKAIPESARVVAIVDVYDALSHDRVYRPALPEAEVLAIMQQGSGTQFDPLLMTHFFLHLSEIRRIAKEHPDDIRDGDLVHGWGRSYPTLIATPPQNGNRRHPEQAAEKPVAEQPAGTPETA